MDDLIKELDLLLSKYGISFNEAIKIYERNQIQTKRLTQCYEDSENMLQYYSSENKNPCGCGSNCYHYEYDRINNVIYGVCNACEEDIYIVKEEYMDEKLHAGKWLSK